MQRTASALSCFSAIAASVLVTSVIPAAAEPGAIELNDHQIEAPASGMALAALEPWALGSKETESERAIGRLVSNPNGRIFLSAEDAIVGIASFYGDPQETASGEQYNPNAFTAAAQLEIRHKFGGVQYGRLYQAAYGLGEYRGKKIIVRFNDVGPLRPGRKFDLSRAAMAYFDSSLDKGLLPDFKMTPLPLGRTYPLGPVTDGQLADLGIDDGAAVNVCEVDLEEAKPVYTASVAQPKPRTDQTAPVVQAKSPPAPVAAKAVTARAATKTVAKAAAKTVTKTAAARAIVKTAHATPAAASKSNDQSQPPVTPWVKRVLTWIASKSEGDQPARPGKRRVMAQAR